MHENSSLAVFAYPFAFALSLMKFYMQENAATMKSLSFFLACLCIVLPILFLALRVLGWLFPFASLVFCIVGVGLLVTSAIRFRRL